MVCIWVKIFGVEKCLKDFYIVFCVGSLFYYFLFNMYLVLIESIFCLRDIGGILLNKIDVVFVFWEFIFLWVDL